MKLLVAEDDLLFQRIISRVLTPEHELIITSNGAEAWNALAYPDAPRMAILDWVMPGLSGPDLCRKIRLNAATSSMYLILLTSKNSQADVIAGLRAGADDYIPKPFSPSELREKVRVGQRILDLHDAAVSQEPNTEKSAIGEARRAIFTYPTYLQEGIAGIDPAVPQSDPGEGERLAELEPKLQISLNPLNSKESTNYKA
jgi:DNA-binding response OmpR family regulator